MALGRNGFVQPIEGVPGGIPIPVVVTVAPGAVISNPADTTVGLGATVPLPVPPAGTLRMTVQVTGGDATSRIRIREVGGAAGAGDLLTLLASTTYGGDGGSIAPLEAQNVTGPSATVHIRFEES